MFSVLLASNPSTKVVENRVGGGFYKFAIYFVQVSSCYYFLFKDVVVVVDDKSLAFKPGGNNFLVY